MWCVFVGFTHYDMLSYAFPVQLIVTDGVQYALCAYQLNSVSALWKPADACEPINFCWSLLGDGAQPLFSHVDSSGVHGLNEVLLRTLVRMMASTPLREDELATRGVVQPYLSAHVEAPCANTSATPTRLVRRFMNVKGHEKWQRPTPPRIAGTFTKRVHPNAPYLLTLVDEKDIIEDIKETFSGKLEVPIWLSGHYARRRWRAQKQPPPKVPEIVLPGLKSQPKPLRDPDP